MLVLNRYRGETIAIGDDVVVEVLEVIGGKVRIGITAPAEVAVHRGEVAAAIRKAKAMGLRVAKPEARQ